MKRSLSNDVRLVGDTLGRVLQAHGGDELFESVEGMRVAAKRAREEAYSQAKDEARAELSQYAARLDPASALDVVRAFTLYFQLVNQAEDVHRTRELRRREQEAGTSSSAESIDAALAELKERGVSRDEALAVLRDLRLQYVFTAHPTEARRRTTERLLSLVRKILEHRDRRILTPEEERTEDRRLRAVVESLWEHAPERSARPEVLDEVMAGLWYFRNVLLDTVPRAQRRLWRAFEAAYGDCDPLALPMATRFGSWMGADRDGNPFVNHGVTERAMELHRRIIIGRYIEDTDDLVDALAIADYRMPEDLELEESLARASAAVPEATMEADRRNLNEPLRRMLTFVRERLVRTLSFSAGAYPNADVFLDDLLVLRGALQRAHAVALPDDALLDLIFRVRCFRFYLAALDVREDSRVHRRVIAELLGDAAYPERPTMERAQALQELELPERGRALSPEARRLLDEFEALRRLQARFGSEAIGTYIISMTESEADVLEVLRLAELHHLDRTLDVVPLFETRRALANARSLLDSLFSDERYRSHLRNRAGVQEVLVGYSDSMKETGVLSSRVLVRNAQCAAAEVCRKHELVLRVFHGRGGSTSRGGGPTYRAIQALPRDAFSGDIKITEQGEVRAFHFANPDLSVRYLEQTLGAALLARHEARAQLVARPENEAAVLARLSDEGLRTYRALIETEGLVPYFRATTPLDQISALHIASRPAKRGAGDVGLADLRAIPWVFAWSQSRQVITGWYGVGSAIDAFVRTEGGLAPLQHLYQSSAFFRDLLDNVQMTLAKTDVPIATRYAQLCGDGALRDRIFGAICEEYERTRKMLGQVMNQKDLLDDDPVLQRSIRLRNPYVDPLSYLQVEALRRVRESTDEDASAWERVIRAAIQGIAAGLRNTG